MTDLYKDKDKLIDVLEKKLKEKESELSELYSLLERLNSYVKNLIENTETGIRSAMCLHRKFATKKIPNVNDITFSSRYIISTSEINSYFDFFALPDDEGAGLVICDANGYGVSAMLMSIVVSLIETPYIKSAKIFMETALKDVNQYLEKDNGLTFNPKGKSAAMVYLMIQKKGLLLKYCSVGMPGIIVARGVDRKILGNVNGNLIQHNGIKSLEIQEGTFKLHPGDRIIVPNNSLVNAVNDSGDKFTMDGLIRGLTNSEHLAIADVVNNVGFELDSFIGSKRTRLPGDLVLTGIELERKMLYVV
ncbi:MAG: SpoIIE family protein phosphatase [Proteobacteria bacterium]|nr:SpoIIE family protein phosphatase [Pseudomonadota bacterium]